MNASSEFRDAILERLPMGDEQLVAAAREAQASEEDLAFARAANRQIAALHALPRPAFPAIRAASVLEAIHDSVIAEREAALRSTARGDLISAGLGPVEPAVDVDWSEHDWSSAVLEQLAARDGGDIDSSVGQAEQIVQGLPATPGWLWLRIRGELRALRSGGSGSAQVAGRSVVVRRITVRQVAAAAALVLAALIVVGIESGRFGLGPRHGARGTHEFLLQRVNQPLAGDFAVGSIVGEVTRGSR